MSETHTIVRGGAADVASTPTTPATNRDQTATQSSVLAGVVGLGVLAGLAAQGLLPVVPVAILVLVPLLVAASVVAAVRFELLVIGLLVARSSLDVFTDLDGSGPPVAAALGGAFLIVGGLWLVVQVLSGSHVRPGAVSIAATALGAVAVFSVIAAENRPASAATAGRIVAGMLMFVILEQLLGQRAITRMQLAGVVVASGVVPVLYGIVEILGPTPLDPITQLPRVSSTFVHPNSLATFLVLVILTGAGMLPRLEGSSRLAVAAVCLGALVVLGYTYSRVGYAALIVGVVYLGGRHSKAIVAMTAIAALASVMFIPSIAERFSDLSAEAVNDKTPANSIEWRFQYWDQLAPLAFESPGTGIGVGSVLADGDWTHAPHSVWLQLAIETGVPGLAAAIALGAVTAHHLFRRERTSSDRFTRTQATAATASALAFATQTGTENLLDSTLLWWYLAAALAIGTSVSTAGPTSSMEQS